MFESFEKVRLWEEIALALLKKYTERYYTFRKREWELPHLEYQDLTEDDPNFPGAKDGSGDSYYRILIEKSQEEIVAKLEELKALIENGDLKPWEFHGLKAIWFGRHLYEPLIYLDQKIVEVSPVPLNKGERQLVDDLKGFHDSNGGFFADKELYLLRNLSKGRGVGFFEAGNFHPDFILWLLIGPQQCVIFVDPKGIRNIGPTDPKIQFHAEIKTIEQRLGDTNVRLEFVHRLEHTVPHDEDALGHGQIGDDRTAHPLPRGGQGDLREDDAGDGQCPVRPGRNGRHCMTSEILQRSASYAAVSFPSRRLPRR